jgi:hypothetical protein
MTTTTQDTKQCLSCGSQKPLTRFRDNRKTCKDCLAEKAKEKYHTSKDFRDKRRNQNMLRLYGITLDTYNKMFAEQDGCCACCGRHQVEFTKALAIDHNHDTGEVRALLCTHCNTAYGSLNEDEERIHQLLKYHRAFTE